MCSGYVFVVLAVPVTSLLMTLTRHRVLSAEKKKTRVFIMATLAAPDISAIVLVLAALLASTEAMPHLSKHRHRHVAAPSECGVGMQASLF